VCDETVPAKLARTLFQRMWRAEQQTHTRHLVQIEGERLREEAEFDAICTEVLQSIFDAVQTIVEHFVESVMISFWVLDYVRAAQGLLMCSYLSKNIRLLLTKRRGNIPTWLTWLSVFRDTLSSLMYSGEVLPSYRVFILCIVYIFPGHLTTIIYGWQDLKLYGLKQFILSPYTQFCSCLLYGVLFSLAADVWDCTTLLRLSTILPLWTLYRITKLAFAPLAANRITLTHILTIVIYCSIILNTITSKRWSLFPLHAIAFIVVYEEFINGNQQLHCGQREHTFISL